MDNIYLSSFSFKKLIQSNLCTIVTPEIVLLERQAAVIILLIFTQ